MKRLISKNSPPKLGGVPSAARRGGSKAELLQHASLEPPRLLAFLDASRCRARASRLAGTPPSKGGEL